MGGQAAGEGSWEGPRPAGESSWGGPGLQGRAVRGKQAGREVVRGNQEGRQASSWEAAVLDCERDVQLPI